MPDLTKIIRRIKINSEEMRAKIIKPLPCLHMPSTRTSSVRTSGGEQ